jgi:hypothetical protein
MTHTEAFSAARRALVPAVDCPGRLEPKGEFPDQRIAAAGPVRRTIYVSKCDTCHATVSLARAHVLVPDAEGDAIELRWELLNSYPGPGPAVPPSPAVRPVAAIAAADPPPAATINAGKLMRSEGAQSQ